MDVPFSYIVITLGITGFLFLMFSIMVIIFILVSKNTHAFEEWKAKRKGIPLCLFFNDDNTIEWKPLKPDSGMVHDKKYGSYIVNPDSNYLDRKKKVVIIPFNSSVGVSVSSKMAHVSDTLKNVIQNPKKLAKLRERIAKGDKLDENFLYLRESINFSAIKRMLNSITPHNINAKINLEVSKRLGALGGANAQALLIMLLFGLGLIALFAFVYDGKTQDVVVQKVAEKASEEAAKNQTQVLS